MKRVIYSFRLLLYDFGGPRVKQKVENDECGGTFAMSKRMWCKNGGQKGWILCPEKSQVMASNTACNLSKLRYGLNGLITVQL